MFLSRMVGFWTKLSTWGRFFVCLQAVTAVTGLFLLWHVPAPGVSVAILAVVAASMSVHPDMNGVQRGVWMILIGAFLIVELQAISKDRIAQEESFRHARDTQEKEFSATADGLKTAIQGIQTTYETANSTFEQTKPHAYFSRPAFMTNGEIAPGSQVQFNTFITNTGNDTAKNVTFVSAMYLGAPDDPSTQKALELRFDMDWKRGQLKPIEIVPTADEFRTFFSPKFDSGTIELINRRKLTVYIITRVSYTDPGGHWFSDDCGSLLLPIELRSIQGKECEPQYNNKRYHPNE